MTRMFSTNPAARIDGWLTLARIVFVGPVLKKRQKQVTKSQTQISGKGADSVKSMNGKPTIIAVPDTRKYDPENRPRSRSPAIPPSKVADSPATHVMPPKMTVADAGAPGLCSRKYGIQNAMPPIAKHIAVIPIVHSIQDGVRARTR